MPRSAVPSNKIDEYRSTHVEVTQEEGTINDYDGNNIICIKFDFIE